MYNDIKYLTIKTESDQHEEEENCPERWDWHSNHGVWIHDERQSGSFRDKQIVLLKS